MSSTTVAPLKVRFARRSTQGLILGLDGWNLGSLAIGAGIFLAMLYRVGIVGVLATAPLWGAFAILGLIRPAGMSGLRFVALWAGLQLRVSAGLAKEQYRPERLTKPGTLNLPGRLRNVRLWDSATGLAVVFDPVERTFSITAELLVSGFLMREDAERATLVGGFSRVLGQMTRMAGVTRVTIQERTVPTTTAAAWRSYREAVGVRPLRVDPMVAANYEGALNNAAPFAVAHRNYLTVTFSATSRAAEIAAFGGGDEGLVAAAALSAQGIEDALGSAEIQVRRWLTPRTWAALGRSAFDPEYVTREATVDEMMAGVDPRAIGPMVFDETDRRGKSVRTDSGWHTTLWIHEWPRSDTHVGFIEPIVFARNPATGRAVTHILSIVLTPTTTNQALKDIREEKKTWTANMRFKSKRGEQPTAADDADYLAITDREARIVAGEGEFRFGAYLTVTCDDPQELPGAVAAMQNAIAQAGLEAQILYCQQAEALMVNALPTGQGMR